MEQVSLMFRQTPWLLNAAIFFGLPWLVGVFALVRIIFEGFVRWLCGKGIYKHELLREVKES